MNYEESAEAILGGDHCRRAECGERSRNRNFAGIRRRSGRKKKPSRLEGGKSGQAPRAFNERAIAAAKEEYPDTYDAGVDGTGGRTGKP